MTVVNHRKGQSQWSPGMKRESVDAIVADQLLVVYWVYMFVIYYFRQS